MLMMMLQTDMPVPWWLQIINFLTSPNTWMIVGLAIGVWLLMVGLFYLFDAAYGGHNALLAAHLALFFGWFLGGGGSVYFYLWWRVVKREDMEWRDINWWVLGGIFGIIAIAFLITLISAATRRPKSA